MKKKKVKGKAKTKAKGKAKTGRKRKRSGVKDLAPRKASAVKGGLLPAVQPMRSAVSTTGISSGLGLPAVQIPKEKW